MKKGTKTVICMVHMTVLLVACPTGVYIQPPQQTSIVQRTCSTLLITSTAAAPFPPAAALPAAAPLAADPARPADAGGAGAAVLAAGLPAPGAAAVNPSMRPKSLLVSAIAAGAPGGTTTGLPCNCWSLQ